MWQKLERRYNFLRTSAKICLQWVLMPQFMSICSGDCMAFCTRMTHTNRETVQPFSLSIMWKSHGILSRFWFGRKGARISVQPSQVHRLPKWSLLPVQFFYFSFFSYFLRGNPGIFSNALRNTMPKMYQRDGVCIFSWNKSNKLEIPNLIIMQNHVEFQFHSLPQV